MTKQVMAFDRSVRRVDDDGHLHVERCILSAAVVSSYWGSEIKDAERLGLKPDVLYQVYRDADALRDAAASMNGKPLIEIHQPISADAHPREITVGAVNNVSFDAPDLIGELSIWDGDAIARIQDGSKRSVSAGYAYDIVPESGSINGQEYSLKMVNIRFNHLALVEKPRVDTAIIGDSASPTLERKSMAGHKPMSPAAKVSAALKAGRLALDASEEDVKKCMDEEEDDRKEAEDEEEEDKDRKAEDSDDTDDDDDDAMDEEEDDKDDRKAADAAPRMISLADARRMARDEAARAVAKQERKTAALRVALDAVRPVVGDVHGMDSAASVYRYALAEQGVAFDGVSDAAGLAAIWRVATQRQAAPRRMASDSAIATDSPIAGKSARIKA
ncbi:DUF2213 domain-containing protein [Asaia sp. BMEF1]|uniref:DUF2213 domain-containing protein n=1 Tax=Asaia sp. BMEF1 TaxID=3155932 RepID=UPI003F67A82B